MARWFRKAKSIESFWGYIFILPAIAVITVFWIIPSVGSIYYSFFKYGGIKIPKFVGIKNYIDFFTDPLGPNSLKVAAYYIVGTLPATIIISFVLAIILGKRWFKGASFFSAVYFMPLVVSYIAVSFIWQWMLEPIAGLVNWFVGLFGLQSQNWLTTPGLALFWIIFISIWRHIGFFTVLYISSIRRIPSSYLDAAQIDGVNEFHKARYITWPLVFPTTIFLSIMSAIWGFQAFDQVYALTSGGPVNTTRIVSFYVWYVGFIEMRMGYSSAIASIIMVIMIILTYVQWRYYISRIQFLE